MLNFEGAPTPTRGPWYIAQVRGDANMMICSDDEEGCERILARIAAADLWDVLPRYEAEANARLMAAAPQLLSACLMLHQDLLAREEFAAQVRMLEDAINLMLVDPDE